MFCGNKYCYIFVVHYLKLQTMDRLEKSILTLIFITAIALVVVILQSFFNT